MNRETPHITTVNVCCPMIFLLLDKRRRERGEVYGDQGRTWNSICHDTYFTVTDPSCQDPRHPLYVS